MSNSQALDTIHNLFASSAADAATQVHESEHSPAQGDVYEQLAQLDYIHIDEHIAATNDIDSLNGFYDSDCLTEPLSLNDVFEGLTQLTTMGVVEVTGIVEAMHREIMLRPLGRYNPKNLDKWPRGITGRIYGTVRHITLFVGHNVSSGLRLSTHLFKQHARQPLPKALEPLINVLNGVMGDHLIDQRNPLAIPMALYDSDLHRVALEPSRQGDYGSLSGRVIILCHGLCMSQHSWQSTGKDSLSADVVSSQLDAQVLYLNYNTGARISVNGRRFSQVLQSLIDKHPDITQIDIVGHSMGGLVARSALFYGEQAGARWTERMRKLITLGSPHQGATLERIGCFVQDLIAKLPFANALAKLGDIRSAGVIDLRYGSIRDADWQSVTGRSVLPPDFCHPARLPRHVQTYLVAATLADAPYESVAARLLGDGLVTLASALGEGDDEHTLQVPEAHKAIFYGVSHFDLLINARVRKQVITWLLDDGQSDYLLRPRLYSYPEDVEGV